MDTMSPFPWSDYAKEFTRQLHSVVCGLLRGLLYDRRSVFGRRVIS